MNTLTLAVAGLRAAPLPLAQLAPHLGPTPALDRFGRAAHAPVDLPATGPAGALSAAAAGDAPGDRWWLRVDPVHLSADAEGLRMAPVTLDDDEAATLVAWLALRLELPIRRAGARDWYTEHAPLTVELAPARAVWGRSLETRLPGGADGQRLRAWINDTQMLLHDHPVNLRRAERGDAPVNSLWPWGAGRLGIAAAWSYARSYSARSEVRGAATLAGRAADALPAGYRGIVVEDATLVQLDTVFEAARVGDPGGWVAAVSAFEHDWLRPALAALDAGALAAVTLLGDGVQYRLTRAMRWFAWRRGGVLAAAS